MSTEYQCAKCDKAFKSRNSLDGHHKSWHKDSTIVTSKDGEEFKIYRHTDGKFHCCLHNYSSRWPHEISKRHGDCFFKAKEGAEALQVRLPIDDPKTLSATEEEIAPPVAALPVTVEEVTALPVAVVDNTVEYKTEEQLAFELLRKFNLEYHSESRYLICLECCCLLRSSFANHLTKNHKYSITPAQMSNIKSSLFVPDEFNFSREPIPQFPRLPTVEGFSCDSCEFNTTGKSKALHHANNFHAVHVSQVTPQLLQYAYTGNNPKFLFRVFKSDHLESAQRQSAILTKELVIRISQNLIDVCNKTERVMEKKAYLGQFYRRMNWLTEKAEIDSLKVNNALYYFCWPQEYNGFKLSLEAFFSRLLDEVDSLDIFIKKDLSPEPEKKNVVFSGLQNDSSKKKYCQSFIDIVAFIFNYATTPIPNCFPVDQAITDKLRSIFAERNIDALVQFLFAEFTVQVPNGKSTVNFITLCYKISCLREDYTLRSAEQISGYGAMLIYFSKVLMVESGKIQSKQDKSLTLQRFVRMNRAIFSIDSLTVAAFVVLSCGSARHDDNSSSALPVIHEIVPGKTIVIRSTWLDLSVFRTIYSKASSRILLLQAELLLHSKPTIKRETLIENLTNTHLTFRMGFKDKNLQNEANSLLLRKILTDRALFSRFIERINEATNQIVWKSEEINRYLRLHAEFIELLLFLIHFTSGMPARTTELESYRISNGYSVPRTCYLHGENIMFYCTYNKTNHCKQKASSICRFLDEEISSVFLRELLVVRPFITFLAESFQRNNGNCYQTFLFVKDGTSLKDTAIRSIISAKFAEFGDIILGIRDYRQVIKYISRRLFIETFPSQTSLDDDEDDYSFAPAPSTMESVSNKQFGHSSLTSRLHYGNTSSAHCGMSSDDVRRYHDSSVMWHDYLRKIVTRKLPPPEAEEPTVVKNVIAEPLVHPTLMRAIPDARIPRKACTFEQHFESLNLLRSFVGNHLAEFNCVEQREAIQNALFDDSHALIVLPTGCGKSLCFFLSALKMKAYTQIVIVPTISLKLDLVRRASEKGISSCINVESFDNDSLLILTVDSLASESILEKLMVLVARGIIFRIFIDECHTIVTERHYRPKMVCVKNLLTLKVPLKLLTGTMTKEIESKILVELFPDIQPVIIQASCNRPNLSFKISEITQSCEAEDKIKEIILELKEKEKIIIYFPTVGMLNQFSASFECQTFTIFHGQLSDQEKAENLESFQSGRTSIILATKALGMGVDFPLVSMVVMVGAPDSLIDYSQMCGRAGRNGSPAETLLLINHVQDELRAEIMSTLEARENFKQMRAFATEKNLCRRAMLSATFDLVSSACYNTQGQQCDNCMNAQVPKVSTRSVPEDNDLFGGVDDEVFLSIPAENLNANKRKFIEIAPTPKLVPAAKLAPPMNPPQRKGVFMYLTPRPEVPAQFRPASASNSTPAARHNEARAEDLNRSIILDLNFLRRFQSECAYCLASNLVGQQHRLLNCRFLSGECARCVRNMGRKHISRSCPSQPIRVSGFCHKCLLKVTPATLLEHNFGNNPNVQGCPNELSREYCCAKYFLGDEIFKRDFPIFEDFWTWIHESVGSKLRCVELFIQRMQE